MLHELRWRKPPRDHRRLWLALTIALLLHACFMAVIWYEMKPRLRWLQAVQGQPEQGIEVRFVARGLAKPQAAPPPVPVPPAHPPREPISKNAMTVRMPQSRAPQPQPAPAMSTPRPVLFDRTGQVVLPASASSVAAAPSTDYVQRAPQGDAQIMQHRAGAAYQSAPNAFKKYFPPPHESFVAGVMRKWNGRQSNTKDVDLPGGIHLKCPKVLGVTFLPNCVMPPPPPPPTDGDERLSMASAPLAKGASVPKPDLAICIADYRAGKPLPYGCPVDTPARAVDAEKHP